MRVYRPASRTPEKESQRRKGFARGKTARAGNTLAPEVLGLHVYTVALDALSDIDDGFEPDESARGIRDAWVLALSTLPLVNRLLRDCASRDPTHAARLAYERGRMLVDGGRRLIASPTVRGDPRWMWCGVPRSVALVPAEPVDGMPRHGEFKRGRSETVQHRSPTDVRLLRCAALRTIGRAAPLAAADHPCPDMPRLSGRAAMYVAWLRLHAQSVRALCDGEPTLRCVPCGAEDCDRLVVAPGSRTPTSRLDALGDLMGDMPAPTRSYWSQLVAQGLSIDRTSSTPSPAYHRFCSRSCHAKHVAKLWSLMPASPSILLTSSARPSRDPIDAAIEAALARNTAAAELFAATSESILQPAEIPAQELRMAFVHALNADLGVLVAAQRIAGVANVGRDTLPGGISTWRETQQHSRTALRAGSVHAAQPQPTPVPHLGRRVAYLEALRTYAIRLFPGH